MSESNGYISPYVGDGYDELVTIPEVRGHWSAAQVRIRRLSADEEGLIFVKKNQNPTEPLIRFYADAFVGGDGQKAKILGWDLKRKNEKGELVPLPLSKESICGLLPAFYELMKGYIDGTLVLPSGETQVEVDVKNS